MEGAGASFFSHAAELATREMDSAHEEPELPSAIQDLLQRLEGQGEPITELPRLSGPEFREFFPRWVAPSTVIGWQSQVRRRVLEAIGRCNTFEILDVFNFCGGLISTLTPSEWEVVLRGFRCSTVLKKITVYGLYFSISSDSLDADKESLCLQLGRILNSSSVTELQVRDELSARCLSNLASGLRGRSDSKLKSLDLWGKWEKWEDSSAVKYVADMINSAPLLETLRLGGYFEDMEDETLGILSQALIQSLALKEFTLDQAGKWAGPLLLKALAGDHRNRSIERLRLRFMKGLGDCLRELLISNPSLKEVELDELHMEPEQAHQLGEAIRDNAIATTILVRFRGEEWKSIEALALSASSIFSHAAELATREMDSAHEEPELPSAIQDLVQRLEGQGEPITELPDFVSWSEPLSTIIGWRSQVRLRVLEAIGSCNTLEILNVRRFCGGNLSTLTAREWEVVLRGFRCSTVLKKITVAGLFSSDDADKESLCLQLGRILNSSSVTELAVRARLSARCLSNLASGLRGHSDSKLKSLDLWRAWKDSSGVKYVADMINSAPLLETLRLGGYWEDMEDETVGILSQALIQSLALKEFTLDRAREWAGRLLLKALAGDDRNRSIERLRLKDMDGLGDCLRELLISNPSLKEVELHPLLMEPEKAHQLGEAIRDNAIATTILVRFRGEEWKSIEALARSASSEVNDPTLEITLHVVSEDEVMLSLNLLGRVLRGEITSLKSLSISRDEDDRKIITFSIPPMNGKSGETSVLKRLELSVRSEDLSKEQWEDLLRCMRGNLTHLDLSDSELDEKAFRDLMGVLQVNLALQEIDVSRTSWATDGKAAQIEEALKQNQKRAVYMSVFREANLTFGDAKAGRLFLCGSPRAGKTQLRKTLMSINHSWLLGSSLSIDWVDCFRVAERLWRTKGIEVEYLQTIDKMQISVWDLAGQSIFRTLQNVLFPQTNNFCVFLFVYSPFCDNTSKNKPDSCFKTELEDWLSFITSSVKITGRDLPQVFVVISHKDKAKYSSVSWTQTIIEELNQRFANFVDLLPVQECFHVDARNKKQIIPLNRHILENFNKLLSEKSPQVPLLCSQLISLFVAETKKNRSCPLWSYDQFHDFCAPYLKKFIPSSSRHFEDDSKIMESIIFYLNEVGSIIYISNLKYIIVDPNWLTNTFLGELIALGQNFQAQETEFSNRTCPYGASKDGFVSESVFVRLIEEFLREQAHGQSGVGREQLENILVNLDLCFKLEDSSQYFIPSFIPEHASKEEHDHQEGAHLKLMCWENTRENSQFVGIRIQCQDGRTMSLTAAFFPRLQVRLNHAFTHTDKLLYASSSVCNLRMMKQLFPFH
ncbi:hypothetical protein MPTK1_4g13541 [Marchantia polymorpha subsp. ruderalis]